MLVGLVVVTLFLTLNLTPHEDIFRRFTLLLVIFYFYMVKLSLNMEISK